MHALLDMPVSATLVSVLEQYGYTGIHISQLGLATAADTEILQRARESSAVIITADLDFPRLLALSAADGPGTILFRGGNYSDVEMRELLMRVLEVISEETLIKSICVVDRERIRVTQLPLR